MKINLTQAKQYTFAFCLIGLIAIISNTAAANDSTAIDQVLCKVVKLLSGTVGKAVATIALIVLGIGLFMGKLSWPLALATAIGIGFIFGAPSVVNYLAGSPNAAECASS
jgi:type IV secretory pathway VirB2 component (pilin)